MNTVKPKKIKNGKYKYKNLFICRYRSVWLILNNKNEVSRRGDFFTINDAVKSLDSSLDMTFHYYESMLPYITV